MITFKKIQAPVDGFKFAQAALAPALGMAELMGVEVVLFRVARPIPCTEKPAGMPDLYKDCDF